MIAEPKRSWHSNALPKIIFFLYCAHDKKKENDEAGGKNTVHDTTTARISRKMERTSSIWNMLEWRGSKGRRRKMKHVKSVFIHFTRSLFRYALQTFEWNDMMKNISRAQWWDQYYYKHPAESSRSECMWNVCWYLRKLLTIQLRACVRTCMLVYVRNGSWMHQMLVVNVCS